MKFVAIISCYFERSVVTLKLRKEYLITVTYNTSVLHRVTRFWFLHSRTLTQQVPKGRNWGEVLEKGQPATFPPAKGYGERCELPQRPGWPTIFLYFKCSR